jgi:hypothetical protein
VNDEPGFFACLLALTIILGVPVILLVGAFDLLRALS